MKKRRGERARARSRSGKYLKLHRAQASEARAGIGQLRELLADAAGRLARGFGDLAAIAREEGARGFACRATRLVPARAANDAPGAAVPQPPAGQAGMSRGDLAQACREVVTALQFQDIADQLLGQTAGRIERLETIALELGRLAHAGAGGAGEPGAVARASRARASVSQRSLGAGEIELF